VYRTLKDNTLKTKYYLIIKINKNENLKNEINKNEINT